MNKKLFFFLTIIILLFTISCSSQPRKSSEINTRRNRAADYSGFAHRYFRDGLFNQALVFYYMALDENIAADFEPGKSIVKNSIGRTHLLMGNLDSAEIYIQQSYNLAKKLGNRDLIASAANVFAELRIFQNLIPEAEKFISEAIENTGRNTPVLAEIFHNLAIIEHRKGNSAQALATINNAITINRRNKAHLNLAANYYFAASVYSQQNNFDKAIEMLKNALIEDRRVENSYGIAKDYRALGIVSLRNNRKEDAYYFFVKSLNIFRVIRNTEEEKSVLEFLIQLSEDLGKTADVEILRAQLQNLE
ncbi:MAG: tetratricopeptide repeat protein [Spirochaetaceae bacterium]|nr:tetratricopeptide repeat protein [Spirochaetaceae bacterium]